MSNETPFRPATTLSVMLCLTLALLGVDLVTEEAAVSVFKEGQSIETMSVIVLVAAAACWRLGRCNPTGREWHVPAILVLMALRELDLDKRLTSEGVLQLRLYSGPSPLWEKALGLAVIGLILVCAWRFARINLPQLWQGIRQLSAEAWLVCSAALTVIVAKTLDGLGRKLEPLGIELDPTVGIRVGRLEELLELVAYIMLAQAVVFRARQSRAPGLAEGATELPASDGKLQPAHH